MKTGFLQIQNNELVERNNIPHMAFDDFRKEAMRIVEDNGKGFDLAEVQALEFPKRGIGLESIKERTVLFGGSLDIDSAPEQGTTLRVSWPC